MASSAHEKRIEASPPHDHDAEFNASSISLEKDVALGLVGEHARDIDPEVEARVISKIDWFLIPAMIVGMHMISFPSLCLIPTIHMD
jgi:hypothetical protein